MTILILSSNSVDEAVLASWGSRILFSGYAFEFYLSELANLVSDKIQILLHPFFFSFVVSVNLSYNELGITMNI